MFFGRFRGALGLRSKVLADNPFPLPAGISSRQVETATGLNMHLLEAGDPSAPLALLLHGFPELAYSWRRVMVPLAEAGYHVVAPDQRGYGRTTGWNGDYDGDVRASSIPCLVRDVLALLEALGRSGAHSLIGHDFGSPVAAWCAMIRPDLFGRVALMSAPFGGPPPLGSPAGDALEALTRLPRPRKHYQRYYSTRSADGDMRNAPQGLKAFLRAYYHVKSADWAENRPHKLTGWTAEELAKLPTYYVMDLAEDMAETVLPHMPDASQVAACEWLPDDSLAVYAEAFGRTGFQGALNWYRCAMDPDCQRDLSIYGGRRIEIPACFIAGSSDWGYRQKPGDYERMADEACADFRGAHLIDGAGHWVQQEQPDATVARLLDFMRA